MALSEFELIKRFFRCVPEGHFPAIELGVGDDAAIMRPDAGLEWVVSTDALVSGRHFPENGPADLIAYRGLASAVSDLAAMAADPLGFTLALTLPDVDEAWLKAFAGGLAEAAAKWNIPLVGGDTCRGPLQLSFTVMGTVPKGKARRRSAARAGQDIWLSGNTGMARAALAVLDADDDGESNRDLLNAYYRPEVPLRFASDARDYIGAAVDISDGLLADLGHLLDASGCGARLDATWIPLAPALLAHCDRQTALVYALNGGDDYQLCFTADVGQREVLRELGLQSEVSLTLIGEIEAGHSEIVGLPEYAYEDRGYRHF